MGLFDAVGAGIGGHFGGLLGAGAGGFLGSQFEGGDNGPPSRVNRKTTENPMLRKLQDYYAADSQKAPVKLQNEDVSGMVNTPLPEYSALRQQVKSDIGEQFNQRKQEGQDQLDRAQARAGGLSGAFIRQGEILRDKLGQQEGEAVKSQLAPLDFQEAQAKRGLQEAATGRNLQRDLVNADNEFKNRVFNADNQSKLFQLDLAWKGFEEEQAQADFNAALSGYNAAHSGGLFGSGGFLGLGI